MYEFVHANHEVLYVYNDWLIGGAGVAEPLMWFRDPNITEAKKGKVKLFRLEDFAEYKSHWDRLGLLK